MRDSGPTEAERGSQPRFRFGQLAAGLLLLASIALFDRWIGSISNRAELGPKTVALRFSPVILGVSRVGPLHLAGAWEVTSTDPRLGGVSALAVEGQSLVALTDSGAIIRFAPPAGPVGIAEIRELPDGPGSGRFKRNRDSEALARDPHGRGWWVAFENRHELWLYDPGFRSALHRIELGARGWRANKGVEGIAVEGGELLLFPESGDSILRLAGSRARHSKIANPGGRISDAVEIGPGKFLVIERRMTPVGFKNVLVTFQRDRFGRRIALPLGAFDNAEAIAVERLPSGRRRLWLMTDDNFQPPLRTLLIALDTPAERRAPKN